MCHECWKHRVRSLRLCCTIYWWMRASARSINKSTLPPKLFKLRRINIKFRIRKRVGLKQVKLFKEINIVLCSEALTTNNFLLNAQFSVSFVNTNERFRPHPSFSLKTPSNPIEIFNNSSMRLWRWWSFDGVRVYFSQHNLCITFNLPFN